MIDRDLKEVEHESLKEEMLENPTYWASKERDKFWMKRVEKLKEMLKGYTPNYDFVCEEIDKIMGSSNHIPKSRYIPKDNHSPRSENTKSVSRCAIPAEDTHRHSKGSVNGTAQDVCANCGKPESEHHYYYKACYKHDEAINMRYKRFKPAQDVPTVYGGGCPEYQEKKCLEL